MHSPALNRLRQADLAALQALDNPSYPHLRQAAIACISKAHTVLEDDPKLFAILGGLSKAQINLCTYFFARERPNNA